jgi:hypothetical protein
VRWRLLLWIGLLACVSLIVGCSYGSSQTPLPVTGISSNNLERSLAGESGSGAEASRQAPANSEVRRVLLDNVIELVQSAPTTPGGRNFDIATDNLNQFFEGYIDPQAYIMPREMRDYLMPRLKERGVKDLETRKFTARDGRHLEDCLLYHTIAARVAGQGDDLSRAQAIFDWVVRQIQLVPLNSLSAPGSKLPQAQARPYDVLLRGLACEPGGAWAERAWVFMSLCRQVGIDVGLLSYVPVGRKPEERTEWVCVAAIDGKAYLFDTRIGLAIPGPDGNGIATLEEAATIPEVLAQLDLPGQSSYVTTQQDLANGTLTVLIDSSLGYMSTRMKLLQEELAGKNRMVLYRDPIVQRDRFAEAIGPRLGAVELWRLPLEVDYRLFNDPNFVKSTQHSLFFFQVSFPLLSARLDQLRGDLEKAKEKYVSFRKAENLTMPDKKTLVPRPVREGLDRYATYFLALCQLEQNHTDQAEFLFLLTLKELPEPRPTGPYYDMFRWGAQANLGRLFEAKGDARRACGYYCQPDPTPQYHGNLLRARALVWQDPTALPPDPLPPAPLPAPDLTAANVRGAASPN